MTSEKEWFGKERDKRAVRQNAQLITVETRYSGVQKYIYVARKYKRHYFWLYTKDGREVPVLTVPKIIRVTDKSTDPRAFKKVDEWMLIRSVAEEP